MFDTRKIASFISKLRKEKDYTQFELAELLNVSPQAVSKWERGESLPDIGMLPKLSEIFCVSIDSILKGEHLNKKGSSDNIINCISKGDTKQVTKLLNEKSIEVSSLIEISPMIKTSVMDNIINDVKNTVLKPNDIIDLVPFINDDTLNNLLEKIDSNGISIDFISELIPFVNPNTLDKLLSNINLSDISIDFIKDLAPFVNPNTLDKLFSNINLSDISIDFIKDLAPFINPNTLNMLIKAKL